MYRVKRIEEMKEAGHGNIVEWRVSSKRKGGGG